MYNSQQSDDADQAETGVFFNPSNIPTLPDHEQASCEGLITEIEAFKALQEFAAAKTPGTDGLTIEFLKYFWTGAKSLNCRQF